MNTHVDLAAILERVLAEDDGVERLFDTWAEQAASWDSFDCASSLRQLAEQYVSASPVTRGLIDYVISTFCGYTLGTLIRVAAGEDIGAASTQAPPIIEPSDCVCTMQGEARP
jgi:hypothetical protein